MSYSPLTDFIALLRYTSAGVEYGRVPGLDFVVAAMARAGMFQLYVGQTAPVVNQQNTVWLLPSLPSWVAEGNVFLWDASENAYVPATPALWNSLLAPSGYSFQSAIAATNIIAAGTTILAVQRVAPVATTLVLPALSAQWRTGRSLKVLDWSVGVTGHAITLTTPDGATIVQNTSWRLLSSDAQLAAVELSPVPDLNGWTVT